MTQRLTALVALLPLVLIGCSRDSSAPGAPEIPKEEFAQELFVVLCQRLTECCDPNLREEVLARCSEDAMDGEPLSDVLAQPESEVRYNGEEASALIARVNEAACDGDTVADALDLIRGVERVFVSTRSNGDACDSGASGTIECPVGSACIQDQCETRRTMGAPCASSSECAEGLRCGSEDTCEQGLFSVPVGGACTSSFDCVSGSFCDDTVCAPGKAAGQACDFGECTDDLVCVDGMCASPGDVGASCANSIDCIDGLRCDEGVCATRLEAGEACERSSSCQSWLSCEGSMSTRMCVPKAATGEACDSDFDCELGACIDDVCEAPLADGEPCESDRNCASGNCDTIGEPALCDPVIPIGSPCALFDECVEGAYCDDNDVCSPRLEPGASCRFDSDCRYRRCSSIDDTCMPALDLGDGCRFDEECDTGSCSFESVCNEPRANGEVCESFSDCQSSNCGFFTMPGACEPNSCEDDSDCSGDASCLNGSCAPPRSPGDACTDDDQCGEGLCEGGVCTQAVICMSP